MAEYVTLMGAEQVQSAGYAMQRAATDMQAAASSLGYALENHQRFMDDWLSRLQAVMEQFRNPILVVEPAPTPADIEEPPPARQPPPPQPPFARCPVADKNDNRPTPPDCGGQWSECRSKSCISDEIPF